MALFLAGFFGFCGLAGEAIAGDVGSPPVPAFTEVYGLIRSNLTGVTEAELNRAAVAGLLDQFQAQLRLVTNAHHAAETSAMPRLSKSAVFEGAYAYLRIGRVASGLDKEVLSAFEQLRATNKLKGVIVDLRFSAGQDYGAAAQTADLFFKGEQPLLKWGDSVVRSTSKLTAIDLPLIVLINLETSGAAEALAVALRQAEGGLIIGAPSAGRAYVYKEFPLSNGQLLRIAHGGIEAGDGQKLPPGGLTPDIRIAVNPEDEKEYFEDPYKTLPKAFAQAAKPGPAEKTSTQNARRRRNEAELVRMHQEGADFEVEPFLAGSSQATAIVINDPALSRGLDLLKGLALAQRRR